MIAMVSPKETILSLDIITRRGKKKRLYYTILTISTVIHKIFIRTENTITSTHYVNTYHILKSHICMFRIQEDNRGYSFANLCRHMIRSH